jgi:LCP family protein required for cell wall assembly
MAVTILFCLGVAVALGVFLYREEAKQKANQVSVGDSYDMGSGYREIEYQGVKYRYNNLVTAILYAGIDSEGKMEATKRYGDQARADSIAVVVIDKLNKKLSILPISRDTMTQIRRYAMNGTDNGLYTTHIGYAYSYGDGGEVSCENLCEAVSLLLGGIPIREYVVTNIDSMPYINNLAGGITVTVPNDELSEIDPSFYEGATVTLDDSNVSTFLRYRDTSEAFTNNGRMERQKAYVTAYIEKIQQMGVSEITESWDAIEDMEDYLQTSITKNQYLDLMDKIQSVDFDTADYLSIQGENVQGELYNEFYPDEDALMETILTLFYREI